MCGIVGVIQKHGPVCAERLKAMTDALAHRGPDGSGQRIAANVGIGHRRLSIIDLATGAQPMCSRDGNICLTYNGEIYNYQDLRRQLIAMGHGFTTRSDTEVIIQAYREWGRDCVLHLRGMFAFAIVDAGRKEVFLARDHLGIKPLVYLEHEGRFAFSSEIQALRKIEDFPSEIDLVAMDQYLQYQYIPAPKSIFRKVRKLPAGHRMTVGFDARIKSIERYWKMDFSVKKSRSLQDWVQELDAVLRESVHRHLVADVPFGAFLSGGIDSSLVVKYMAEELGDSLKVFSVGFEEQEFTELPYAQQIAASVNAEFHQHIVKSDSLGVLADLVRHYGEPFGDSSAIPTYQISKLARTQVPMVLSGDGGDEAFAGYSTYLGWKQYTDKHRIRLSSRWKEQLLPYAQRLAPGRYRRFRQPEDELHNWNRFAHGFGAAFRESLWRPEYRFLVDVPVESHRDYFSEVGRFSVVNRAQYMDVNTFMPDDILFKVDTASMMNSLEVRTPIIDRDVYELAATIPEHCNLRKDENGAWEGKWLLKELLGQKVSRSFATRRKRGFGLPMITSWFGDSGRGELKNFLLGSDARSTRYLQPEAVEAYIDRHFDRKVWLLVVLEEWLRQNT